MAKVMAIVGNLLYTRTIRHLRKGRGDVRNPNHSLMGESIEHGERARYLAANAVQDLQRGRHWSAEGAMAMAAMQRHLQYEKWDTAEIANDALKECWATRG